MVDFESLWLQIGRKIKLEGLFDVVFILIKFQNILIQYYSIKEDEW